jgi:hypothetical protein
MCARATQEAAEDPQQSGATGAHDQAEQSHGIPSAYRPVAGLQRLLPDRRRAGVAGPCLMIFPQPQL